MEETSTPKARPELVKSISEHLQVETYVSPGHDHAFITEIADFYRWIYNNTPPAGHFLYYPESGDFRSPQKVFSTDPAQFVDISLMDTLDPLPQHPDTGESPIVWHDPKTVQRIIQAKLLKNGFASILRECGSGHICGLAFGHVTTLRKQFRLEGWENPLHYAGKNSPGGNRSFSDFLDRLNTVVSHNRELATIPELQKTDGRFVPDSHIHSWNSVAIAPRYQGHHFLFPLLNGYFSTIPSDVSLNYPTVGESRVGSTSYELFHAAGYQDVPDILSSKPRECLTELDSTIIVNSSSRIAEAYSKSAKDFVREHLRPYRKQSRSTSGIQGQPLLGSRVSP